MERAGVHVVFGFLDLKTHCKVSLVVRQEGDVRAPLRPSGNRQLQSHDRAASTPTWACSRPTKTSPTTPRRCSTCSPAIRRGTHWRKLVVAPEDLHHRTIELIDEQTERARAGRQSRIFAKLNALVDYRVIEALYRASQAGVPIDLVVRGVCCLRPGLPGISENIRVRSIVDRFLEHSRVYVFSPDDEAQVFLASADWMPRNFYRRVEVMFPIEAPRARERILEEIVPAYLRDNVKARILRADGTHYRARAPLTSRGIVARKSCCTDEWPGCPRSPNRMCRLRKTASTRQAAKRRTCKDPARHAATSRLARRFARSGSGRAPRRRRARRGFSPA